MTPEKGAPPVTAATARHTLMSGEERVCRHEIPHLGGEWGGFSGYHHCARLFAGSGRLPAVGGLVRLRSAPAAAVAPLTGPGRAQLRAADGSGDLTALGRSLPGKRRREAPREGHGANDSSRSLDRGFSAEPSVLGAVSRGRAGRRARRLPRRAGPQRGP